MGHIVFIRGFSHIETN